MSIDKLILLCYNKYRQEDDIYEKTNHIRD